MTLTLSAPQVLKFLAEAWTANRADL